MSHDEMIRRIEAIERGLGIAPPDPRVTPERQALERIAREFEAMAGEAREVIAADEGRKPRD
jgi:hypothetical protein